MVVTPVTVSPWISAQLTGALRQKERLAQLGSAVAKISHDLRNILTTAQLFADRLEGSADPLVRQFLRGEPDGPIPFDAVARPEAA